MTTILYGIRNCDTVKKARAWLDTHGVDYAFHDYKAAGVDPQRLSDWADRAGWEALFNRAGTTFRRLPEADRAKVDRDGIDGSGTVRKEALRLMAAHPSLIKRPVVEHDGALLIGFRPTAYAKAFAAGD